MTRLLTRRHRSARTLAFPPHPPHRHLDLPGATPETLTLFEADLLDEGAFDECVTGASCVFHTASPFVTSNITDPDRELIAPALNGNRNVSNPYTLTLTLTLTGP